MSWGSFWLAWSAGAVLCVHGNEVAVVDFERGCSVCIFCIPGQMRDGIIRSATWCSLVAVAVISFFCFLILWTGIKCKKKKKCSVSCCSHAQRSARRRWTAMPSTCWSSSIIPTKGYGAWPTTFFPCWSKGQFKESKNAQEAVKHQY